MMLFPRGFRPLATSLRSRVPLGIALGLSMWLTGSSVGCQRLFRGNKVTADTHLQNAASWEEQNSKPRRRWFYGGESDEMRQLTENDPFLGIEGSAFENGPAANTPAQYAQVPPASPTSSRNFYREEPVGPPVGVVSLSDYESRQAVPPQGMAPQSRRPLPKPNVQGTNPFESAPEMPLGMNDKTAPAMAAKPSWGTETPVKDTAPPMPASFETGSFNSAMTPEQMATPGKPHPLSGMVGVPTMETVRTVRPPYEAEHPFMAEESPTPGPISSSHPLASHPLERTQPTGDGVMPVSATVSSTPQVQPAVHQTPADANTPTVEWATIPEASPDGFGGTDPFADDPRIVTPASAEVHTDEGFPWAEVTGRTPGGNGTAAVPQATPTTDRASEEWVGDSEWNGEPMKDAMPRPQAPPKTEPDWTGSTEGFDFDAGWKSSNP